MVTYKLLNTKLLLFHCSMYLRESVRAREKSLNFPVSTTQTYYQYTTKMEREEHNKTGKNITRDKDVNKEDNAKKYP